MKVRVVTAYVPLKVRHLTKEQYKEFGKRLAGACDGDITVFEDYPLGDCWLSKMPIPMKVAAPIPTDRYASVEENLNSHIVQHNRTSWVRLAMRDHPAVDTWVWLDYGILKQGAWTGKPVTEDVVRAFMNKLRKIDMLENIPFPGIEEKKPINDTGNNWRFCGSTHIWPRQFVTTIDYHYKECCMEFINRTGTVPLDLAIWPAVENTSNLPFDWYKAEYDATQLSNFPENQYA